MQTTKAGIHRTLCAGIEKKEGDVEGVTDY